MGRFKNDILKQNNPILEFLESQGYKNMNGAKGEDGYTKVYPVDDYFYYVWVTINIETRLLSVYKEYDCGGCVGEDTYVISDDSMNDLNLFIDEVDDYLSSWI